MGLFSRIVAALSPAKKPVPLPPPAPVLTKIGDELVDLSRLNPEELLALEARITALAQAQEQKLNANLRTLRGEQPQQVAGRDFATWLNALRILFGPALAHQLSQQLIEPGMQIKHLVASFGPADEIKDIGNGLVRFVYGNEETGSYFDIEGDVIVRVAIVNLPPPPIEGNA